MIDIAVSVFTALSGLVAFYYCREAVRVYSSIVRRRALRNSIAGIRGTGGAGVLTRRLVESLTLPNVEDGDRGANFRESINKARAGQLFVSRALSLLLSTDEEDVLQGCQLVRALGDETMVVILREVGRVWFRTPRVVEYVDATIREIQEAADTHAVPH